MTEHHPDGGGGVDPDRTLLSAEGCRFGGMPFVVEVEGGHRTDWD